MFLQITYGGEKNKQTSIGRGDGVVKDAVNGLLQSATLDLPELTELQQQGLICQTWLCLRMLPQRTRLPTPAAAAASQAKSLLGDVARRHRAEAS